MSGWIDPIGVRALLRYIRSEQQRLRLASKTKHRRNPKTHTGALLDARRAELSRLSSLVQALVRPGAEMRPYKALVQSDRERHDKIERLVPRKTAP